MNGMKAKEPQVSYKKYIRLYERTHVHYMLLRKLFTTNLKNIGVDFVSVPSTYVSQLKDVTVDSSMMTPKIVDEILRKRDVKKSNKYSHR